MEAFDFVAVEVLADFVITPLIEESLSKKKKSKKQFLLDREGNWPIITKPSSQTGRQRLESIKIVGE